ncbi:MAG: HAD hydrolase family protein [Firmicutes bacterium]|nr:HAD hydrolase family protein [Bacillota bacterium]
MISIDIPGRGRYDLKNLVLDMNGTIAVDGIIADEVLERIRVLSKILDIYLITADTHGKLESQKEKIAAKISRIQPPGEASQKADFIESIGASNSVAIGNGANDTEMLKKARLAIAVIEGEGCALDALQSADIVVKSSVDALDLLIHTNRIVATLRK